MPGAAKSLISSVGARKISVWLHDANGEHPLSPEGSATSPKFSADGKRVYYLLRKNTSDAYELWSTERGSGISNAVLPGVPLIDFDISRDGQQVAYTARNGSDFQLFIAPLNGSAPPRPVVRGGDKVGFGSAGELVFRQLGARVNHLARVKTDGTGLERILDDPISDMTFVSPDGNWATVVGVGEACSISGGASGSATSALGRRRCWPTSVRRAAGAARGGFSPSGSGAQRPRARWRGRERMLHRQAARADRRLAGEVATANDCSVG